MFIKNMVLPISEQYIDNVTSDYGMRVHPITKKPQKHNGIDIKAPVGTPVYAAADGIVKYSKLGKGVGEYITIGHGGTYSIYCHLSARLVQQGQSVKAGQVIGLVGNTGDSTGPHLHFGLCQNYVASNINHSSWYDPAPFIEEAREVVKEISAINSDGKEVRISSINKDGYNYVKLRDLEKLIPCTVGYNSAKKMPEVKKNE